MRYFAGLLLSLCALTVSAQEFHEVMLPSGRALTIAEAVPKFVAMKKALHASSFRPSPDVILLDFDSTGFLIPIAGNTAGSFGTYFRSDVTFANLRNAPQVIAAAYFQAGVDNSNGTVRIRQFAAGEISTTRDFVGVLGLGGIGSLFIYASDAQGNPDSNGQIDGYSRIWTPQPGTTGEVSQNFDAVDTNDIIGNGFTYIMGLRQDTRFRSNVGIVNFSGTAHTWTVTSLTTNANSSITVPPYSVIQTGIPANSGGSDGGVVLGLTTNSSDSWSAYGTTNDNTTGDGWVSRAKRFNP